MKVTFAFPWLALLLLTAALVASPGCSVAKGPPVDAGAVDFAGGDLRTAKEVSVDELYNAALAAIEDLEFHVTKADKDQLGAEIVATTVKDKRIDIEIDRRSDEVTEMSISIGLFGDEATSRLILDKIDEHLGE